MITQKPVNCASGGITQTATSATAWGTSNVTTDLTANADYYVNGIECSACSSLGGGLYNTSAAGNSGGASVCKATVTAGSYLAAATDKTLTPCTAGYYCPGTTLAYSNTGGRTQCPSGYDDGTTGYSQQSQCTITCPAGTQVASANADCTTPNNTTYGSSWYTGSHNVTYGNTSKGLSLVSRCVTGYATPNTTTATDHSGSGRCTITCPAGTQVLTPNATCTTPTGNWYTGSQTIQQGAISRTTACAIPSKN